MKLGLCGIALVAVCAAAVGLSCVPFVATSGTGTLRVMITDKPFPFTFISKAVVTITKVEVRTAASQPADETTDETGDGAKLADAKPKVHPQEVSDTENETTETSDADNETTETTETDTAHDSAFVTIFEDAAGKEFNLLDLRNGKADLLGSADIPAGTYTQMRLIVTGGEVTLTDGRVFPLKVPSGGQSGIKLNFTFTVTADQETALLLDVDLSRAFSAIPSGHIDDPSKIRQFRFQPSIAMRLINLLEAGSISGKVTDSASQPLAAVAVTALKDGAEVTTTSTEADGTYKLGGLTTGTYTVEFSLAGYDDVSVADVAVTAGQDTKDVDATLTASAPAP